MSEHHRIATSKILHALLIAVAGLSIPLYFIQERNKLQENIEHFGEALAAADAGRWYWHLDSGELLWDDQMFTLFGKSKKNWSPNCGGFEDALHPEDKDRVNALVKKAIADRGGYQDVFRVVADTGEVRNIRSSGMVSNDGTYMTGLCLPAINRPGNFIRTKVVPPALIPGVGDLQGPPRTQNYVESAQTIQN